LALFIFVSWCFWPRKAPALEPIYIKLKSPEIKAVIGATRTRDLSDYAQDVSGGSRTLVVTYASRNYATSFLNWYLAFSRLNVQGLLVVCLDESMVDYMSLRGLSCYYEEQMEESHLNRFETLWTRRVRDVLILIRGGWSVVMSDLDALWRRDFTLTIASFHRDAHIVGSRGKFPWDVAREWGASICMGLVYFRACEEVVQVLEATLALSVDTKDDQVALNRVLKSIEGSGFSKTMSETGNLLEEATLENGIVVHLLPHNQVPRFCKALTSEDWKTNVVVAHCHVLDGVNPKNQKNRGDVNSRDNVMKRYHLWCDYVDKSVVPDTPTAFRDWVHTAINKCQ